MSLKLLSLKRISFSIAKYIAKVKNEGHVQRYLYYYSLQIVLGTIVELIAILLISWVFGFLIEAIICSAVFVSIRFFAGGYHSDTYTKCFASTIALMILTPFTAKLITNYYPISIHIIIFAVVLYLTYKFAPCDTVNKPITSKTHIKRLRIQSLALVIFWFGVSLLLVIIHKYTDFISVIGLAALLEAVSLTPWIANKAPLRQKCSANALH